MLIHASGAVDFVSPNSTSEKRHRGDEESGVRVWGTVVESSQRQYRVDLSLPTRGADPTSV